MADLSTNFVGIKSPNPFWLASAPPTDKEYNVRRAFEAGWGGVVWKTLGSEGPPIVNVNGPRYGAIWGADRRLLGLNNIELITDRPLEVNLREIKTVKRDYPDRAMVVSIMVPLRGIGVEGDPAAGRGNRRRRDRAELRLPAWHERARHGRGGRPGARIHRDGGALVQAIHPHAGDREADAQHHRYPLPGPRRQAWRGRCGQPHQHDLVDHRGRSRQLQPAAVDRRQGQPWRLLRPGGQADRAQHGAPRSPATPRPAACRSAGSAGSRHGATRPSSSRWARARCRSARRR